MLIIFHIYICILYIITHTSTCNASSLLYHHNLYPRTVYNCKQRRLLNNRKFAFCSLGKIGFDDREGIDHIHPLTLVQNVLRKALQPMDGSDTTALDDFLDAASQLKTANLIGLSEGEKCAFVSSFEDVCLVTIIDSLLYHGIYSLFSQ